MWGRMGLRFFFGLTPIFIEILISKKIIELPVNDYYGKFCLPSKYYILNAL